MRLRNRSRAALDVDHAAPPTLSSKAARGQSNQPIDPKQAVARLRAILAEIDRLPLPVGELGLGTAFLDCLELTDQIRAKARELAKEVLLREPGIIPGWTASKGGPVRELSKNTWKVFEALAQADDPVTQEEFIGACTISLGAVRKLLSALNPTLGESEVEFELDKTLRPLLHHRQGTVRLTRSAAREEVA